MEYLALVQVLQGMQEVPKNDLDMLLFQLEAALK